MPHHNEPPRPKPPSLSLLPYCDLSVLLLRRAHVQAHVLERVLLYKEHGQITAAQNFLTFVLQVRKNPEKTSPRILSRPGIEPGPTP